MNRSTLQKLVERLPRALQNRYSLPAGEFWVNAYNDLLAELERTACGPNGIIVVPVPWEMAQGEVVLPQQLVDVTKAYRQTSATESTELTIRSSEGGFYILDEGMPSTSTMVAHSSISGVEQGRGRGWIKGSAIASAKAGDAVIVHNSSPSGDAYYMADFPYAAWVASVVTENPSLQPICAIPYEVGEQDWAPAESEHAFIFRDFVAVVGHRRYKRATTLDSLSSIPPDWDDLAATWLRFRGETQTDAESDQSVLWAQAWKSQAERWKAFHARSPSGMKERGLHLPLIMNGRR